MVGHLRAVRKQTQKSEGVIVKRGRISMEDIVDVGRRMCLEQATLKGAGLDEATF